MIRRAAAGATLARRPLVVKLVADEAYERERRSGRFAGSLEEFQRVRGGVRVRLLRTTRNAALRRAGASRPERLPARDRARLGTRAGAGLVVPNPAPPLPALPSREEARAALGINGPALGTGGPAHARRRRSTTRSTAVASVDGVALLVLGDGPERAALERRAAELGLGGRVRFLGAGSRDDVMRLFPAVDAVLLTSAWENLPHTCSRRWPSGRR